MTTNHEHLARTWATILAESGATAQVVAGPHAASTTVAFDVADGKVTVSTARPRAPFADGIERKRKWHLMSGGRHPAPIDDPFVWAEGVVPDGVEVRLRLREAAEPYPGLRRLVGLLAP